MSCVESILASQTVIWQLQADSWKSARQFQDNVLIRGVAPFQGGSGVHCTLSLAYLITSTASWLYLLSVVPATVHLPVLLMVEIDEIHQELVAVLAGEAWRVPAGILPCTIREHCHLTNVQSTLALLTDLGVEKEVVNLTKLNSTGEPCILGI